MVTIDAAPDGDNHLVTITDANISVAGEYTVQGYVKNGAERHTVYSGRITVTPDLTALSGTTYDGRTHAQRVIDAIEAVIEGRATKDQEEMWIDRNRLVRTPFETLMKIRDRYRQELAAQVNLERRRQGRGNGRSVKFRL